jgi:colanic acid/amylovoran biosynthesis glycosyltransferase
VKPLVASYCTFFLKAEMQHIYRQVTRLRQVETFVITKYRENADRYPFSDIELLRKQRVNPIWRAYLKYVADQPGLIYRGELETIRRILIRRDPDLMHIYFGNTGVHLLPLIERWDRPCLVSFHGMDVQSRPDERGYDQKLRRLLQVVPLALVRSRSIADRLTSLGCDPSKIRLNQVGIPLNGFPHFSRPVPTNGEWRLVQACRLIPKKGLPTALKAFAKFIQTYPKARFTIAGDGPMRQSLDKVVEDLGLGEQVRFTAFLDQSKLRALYEDSHIFIHPSELSEDGNQEGIPNSMLEAMATGLPVAATRHGGIPEAVTEGETGYLVAERDDEALASALLKLADDLKAWRKMGQAATAAVAEHFELARQIEVLESCYLEGIERWRKSRKSKVAGSQ